jgi:hypothetical protein
MKKIFSFLGASVILGLVACNNDSTTTGSNDSTVTTNTVTSTGDYAAKADSIRINSEAGNYLDAKTGKAVKLKMDASTGQVTNAETGEPVWRYVDRRNWWVYGGDNWDKLGEARMDSDHLMYRTDDDKWVDYDVRWKDEDMKLEKDWKAKYGDTKVKVGKDGDIKVKDEEGKVKYDADDNKIKTDSSH